MKILLIDNGTRHLGKLKKLLTGNDLDIRPLFQKYPPSTAYDLVILSGGSQVALLSAPEIFKEEINLVRNANTPVIGICEGCEIIAYAFGSRLELVIPKIKGIKQIEVSDLAGLNLDKPFEVYETHYWAIKELGANLVGIAKSKYGYEIIKHIKKPIYGIQFHPEMLIDETLGDEIFRSIVACAVC